MKFKSDIEVQAGLKDSSGSNGLSGQVLSSNGTTVSWINAGGSFAETVKNQVKASVAINKGQAVYETGADGTNIVVGLASNASEATSSKTLGLLDATVAINGFANVVQIGKLSGLNTSGATAGDPVWLGVNGNLIYGLANKPYAPKHLVFIGVVTRVNANNGEIFVNVQNGFELNEIHDVDLITNVPINGDVLGFNGTLWVNKTIAGWLGYTPANDANVVHKTGDETISGVKTFSNNIIGNAFVKSGGTVDQYLKADGSVSTAMNSRVEVNFIATSGQTTFTTPYEVGQVEVYYNGSKLYPDEFVATNGTSVVLVTPATLNAQISIVKYVSSFNTTSIRTESVFTTTAGQTTFAVNYAIGQVDVFYNGSKLSPAEFTATNGISVVLGFACAAGESIVIDSFVNQVSGAVGTANKVAKFTGAASLGDSQIFDNGTNVGIGTITPSQKLQINGALALSNLAEDFTTNQEYAYPIIYSGNLSGLGNGELVIQPRTTATRNIRFVTRGAGAVSATNPDTRMMIKWDGNIGVGTTSPLTVSNYKIITINDVSGSGYATQTNGALSLYSYSNANGSTISEQRNLPLFFETNGEERMRIFANGNVFIGSSPADAGYKLDVNGNARFSGSLTGTSASFGSTLSVNIGGSGISLTGTVGSNSYYVMDQTPNSGGKRWRFGHTGAIGGFGSFDFYNQTDNITALTLASTGVATFTNAVTTKGTANYNGFIADNSSSATIGGGYFSAYSFGVQRAIFGVAGAISGTADNNVGIFGEAGLGIKFFVNGSGTASHMMTSSGNVLIGTATDAGYKLDVNGSTRLNGTANIATSLSVGGDITASNANIKLYTLQNTPGQYRYIGSEYNAGNGNNKAEVRFGIESDTYTFLSFATASGANTINERMRITSGGNVGIGTTSPPEKFSVNASSSTWGSIIRNNSKSLVALSHGLGYGMAIDSVSNVWATYLFKVAGGDGTNMGTVEYFKITGSGALYSAPTYSNTSGSGANLGVASDGFFYRSTSSLKYKKNVENYEKGLNEIMQMRPVKYNSINESEDGIQYAGLIAEEVHDLGLTEFVQYAEDGTPDALAYSNMVALLVKGIQELKAEIEILKNK